MARTAFTKFSDMRGSQTNSICAEIGVAAGSNAVDMMSHNPKSKFVLVDPYKPYFSETGREQDPKFHWEKMEELNHALINYRGRYVHVHNNSKDAANFFEDGLFDFVYIDGDHSREAVREDIISWLPKVKTGGMLSGHDWHIVGDHIKDLVPNALHDEFTETDRADDWWIIK